MADAYKSSIKKIRRGIGFRPVATLLSAPSKKIGAKRGFHDQFLIANWREIMGDEIANMATPHALHSTRNKGATLVLECLGAFVAELTMRVEEIRIKINSTLGHDAISKVTFSHQAFGFAESRVSFSPKPRLPKPVPADMKIEIENIGSSELKEALKNISVAFYNVKDSK